MEKGLDAMKGPSKQASALSPQAELSITWTVQDLTSTSPMMAPSSTWNTRCQRPPAALPPRGRHRQHGLAPGELTLGRTPCCRSIAPLSPQGPRRKQQEQKPASRCFACGPAVAGVGGGAGSQDKYLCAPRKEGGHHIFALSLNHPRERSRPCPWGHSDGTFENICGVKLCLRCNRDSKTQYTYASWGNCL